MAYNLHLAKVYNAIKNLKEGQEITITKEVAHNNAMLCLEDVAEWAGKANGKVKVIYLGKGSRYVVRSLLNEVERCRKVLKTTRYNIANATTCTPEQVEALHAEEQITAKLTVWTGLATYFKLEK